MRQRGIAVPLMMRCPSVKCGTARLRTGSFLRMGVNRAIHGKFFFGVSVVGSAEHIVDSGADHHRSVARMAVSTQRPRGAGITMRAARAFFFARPLHKPAFGRIRFPPTSS